MARKKGAVLLQKAEKIHWELKADREKLEFDKRRKSEVGVRICVLCFVFCVITTLAIISSGVSVIIIK